MKEYKNLEEIIELCEEELNNNDKNVTAILDLTDLKELRHLLARVKQLEVLQQSCPAMPTTGVECEFKNKVKELEQTLKDNWEFRDKCYILKSKVKEKIEELTNTKGDFATYIATSERIKVLQELLESGD